MTIEACACAFHRPCCHESTTVTDLLPVTEQSSCMRLSLQPVRHMLHLVTWNAETRSLGALQTADIRPPCPTKKVTGRRATSMRLSARPAVGSTSSCPSSTSSPSSPSSPAANNPNCTERDEMRKEGYGEGKHTGPTVLFFLPHLFTDRVERKCLLLACDVDVHAAPLHDVRLAVLDVHVVRRRHAARVCNRQNSCKLQTMRIHIRKVELLLVADVRRTTSFFHCERFRCRARL